MYGRGGFSLLEILVSLFLLSVLATGATGVWTWSQRGAKFQEETQAVELYLDKKMAELKLNYARTRSLPSILLADDFPAPLENKELKVESDNVEQIGDETDESVSKLKRVKLTFSWDSKTIKSGTAIPKSRELTSYFFKE